MPSKKKKYNARFPPGRIKKIMQTDEEVGKVAQAVPIIISKTLELFVHSLLTKTMQIANAKQAKTLSPSHMKQCILAENKFDFLKDLVKNIPDVSLPDDDPNLPATLNIQPITINNAPMATFAPKSTTVVINAPNNSTPFVQKTPRRNSKDKGNNSKLATPEATNEAVLSCNVPKFTMSVPTSFNASQPNFYTEVNPSDNNVPRCSSFSQPVSKFAYTASLEEDYDT